MALPPLFLHNNAHKKENATQKTPVLTFFLYICQSFNDTSRHGRHGNMTKQTHTPHMSNNNCNKLGEAPWLHVIISTVLGTGFFPWGPGTFGGLIALLAWIGLYYALSPIALCAATVALVVVTLFVGVWTDNVMERYWGEDPRTVIIDEYFGTWTACLPALLVDGPAYLPISLATIGFVLFRIIDITKPLGCRWVDRHIHGGWGCMLDDALAAAYAAAITLVIRHTHTVEKIHDLIYS